VNHRHALLFREGHDALDVQIRTDRALRGIQLIGLVRLEAVDRKAVLLGEDRDGRETEFVGCAENPNGDFTAVGGHQFSGASLDIKHVGELSRCSRAVREAEIREISQRG